MRNKILEIITYHSDDGTSGYVLSNEQIDKLLFLFKQEAKKCVPEEVSTPKAGTYREEDLDDYIKYVVAFNQCRSQILESIERWGK